MTNSLVVLFVFFCGLFGFRSTKETRALTTAKLQVYQEIGELEGWKFPPSEDAITMNSLQKNNHTLFG